MSPITWTKNKASWLLKARIIKFGCVGISGTVINLLILFIAQEHLYSAIAPENQRFHLSLVTAITLSTFNNYLWNRHWTWADRKKRSVAGFFTQMGQYYLSCICSITCQYIMTIALAQSMHYSVANLISIGFAAIITYAINHIWTFAKAQSEG